MRGSLGRGHSRRPCGSLSLEGAGARSHVGSPQGLYAAGAPDSSLALPVGPPLPHTVGRWRGLVHLLGLSVYGKSVAEGNSRAGSRAFRMSPAFPVAVLVTGCDSSLSRRQTGYQSSACHRGRDRKAWEPSKQSEVPVSDSRPL